MKKIYITLGLMLSSYSFANSTYTGKILKVHSSPNNNFIYLILENEQNNKGACHTNTYYEYVFDASTDAGKNVFGIILTAYASGREVYAGGSQTCNAVSGVEDLKWLRLQ